VDLERHRIRPDFIILDGRVGLFAGVGKGIASKRVLVTNRDGALAPRNPTHTRRQAVVAENSARNNLHLRR